MSFINEYVLKSKTTYIIDHLNSLFNVTFVLINPKKKLWTNQQIIRHYQLQALTLIKNSVVNLFKLSFLQIKENKLIISIREFVYYYYTDNTVNFCNSIFFQTQMAHLHKHTVCKFCSDYFLFIFLNKPLKAPDGSMSQVVGLPNNSYKPITNTAWVHVRLCTLQKKVHSTRSRK